MCQQQREQLCYVASSNVKKRKSVGRTGWLYFVGFVLLMKCCQSLCLSLWSQQDTFFIFFLPFPLLPFSCIKARRLSPWSIPILSLVAFPVQDILSVFLTNIMQNTTHHYHQHLNHSFSWQAITIIIWCWHYRKASANHNFIKHFLHLSQPFLYFLWFKMWSNLGLCCSDASKFASISVFRTISPSAFIEFLWGLLWQVYENDDDVRTVVSNIIPQIKINENFVWKWGTRNSINK